MWQIEASKVAFLRDWDTKVLPQLVRMASDQLAIDHDGLQVEARLNKLLIYVKGSDFKSDKETDKEPGTFGTLLVQLPAEHEGGGLKVEHNGMIQKFNDSKNSDFTSFYTAFYDDCRHKVIPVERLGSLEKSNYVSIYSLY